MKHFNHQQLENSLKEKLSQINASVLSNSEAIGKRNLPEKEQDSYAPYWEQYHGQYQELVSEVNTTLQVYTVAENVQQSTISTNVNIRKIENQIDDAKAQLSSVKSMLKGFTESSHNLIKCRLIMVVIGCICLFDALINVSSFLGMGATLIEATGFSLLLAIVLMSFVHLAPKAIALGKSNIQKWGIVGFLILLSGTLFYILSESRSSYLTNLAKQNGLDKEYSSAIFIIVSVFLLFVAVGLAYHRQTLKGGLDLLRKREKLVNERRDLEKLIKGLETNQLDCENNHKEMRALSASILNFGASLESRIISEAHRNFGVFKTNGLRYRTDIGKPDCFGENYPFVFETHFTQAYNKSINHILPLLLFGIFVVFSACHSTVERDAEIVIIVDETSPIKLYPQANEILELSGITNDINKGVKIQFEYITDHDYTPSKVYTLPASSPWSSVKDIREHQVKQFRQRIIKAIDSIHADTIGIAKHSFIYNKLTETLIKLNKSKSSEKYLIVYSDLLEHSQISCYDSLTLKAMSEKPDSMTRVFERMGSIPALSNITIHFLYQTDFKTNARYRLVSSFFSQMLTKKHAVVQIGASLNQ